MNPEQERFVAQVAARYGDDLLRYLVRRVRSAADAKDLAQEAYLRLLRLNEPALVRDPQAYLFRVAANIAYEFRLKQPMTGRSDSLLQEEPATDLRDPEYAADRPLRASRLKRALSELSPKCRTVFILHRRDDMTYEEIARHVGISTSMVKKYLGMALKHCRTRLRDMEP